METESNQIQMNCLKIKIDEKMANIYKLLDLQFPKHKSERNKKHEKSQQQQLDCERASNSSKKNSTQITISNIDFDQSLNLTNQRLSRNIATSRRTSLKNRKNNQIKTQRLLDTSKPHLFSDRLNNKNQEYQKILKQREQKMKSFRKKFSKQFLDKRVKLSSNSIIEKMNDQIKSYLQQRGFQKQENEDVKNTRQKFLKRIEALKL